MADSTNKIYYFESALSPSVVWVNLNKINLGPGSGIRAVKFEDNYSIIGNIDSRLAPAKPISYLAPTPADTAPSGDAPSGESSGAPDSPAPQARNGFQWWWLLPVVGLAGPIADLGERCVRPRASEVYGLCMSRTNIDLDDVLVAEVMRRYGVTTKKDAVDLALRRLVGVPLTRDFLLSLEGIGWEGSLDGIRSEQPSEL